MKQTIYILTLTFGLGCGNNNNMDYSNVNAHNSYDNNGQLDTSKIISSESHLDITETEFDVSIDSIFTFQDSHFFTIEADLLEITNIIFNNYKNRYKVNCNAPNDFIQGKGLFVDRFCKDICEDYLIDKKERIKFILPSSFDEGILGGLIISPSCNRFLVYSYWDGDMDDRFEHRAEVYGFKIGQGQGIQTIKPTFNFFIKDWSIEEVIWINDNEIALKTYGESRSIRNEDKLNYKYFKTKVIK